MAVTKSTFGTLPSGQTVDVLSMTNAHGVQAQIMTYGATLVSFSVPGKDGKAVELTLGVDSLEAYLAGTPYYGATIGRFGNRIANGVFTLDGTTYTLAKNENGIAHLHGGNIGFDKVVWDAKAEELADGTRIRLTYRSPDGDEGYPGTLDVTVDYILKDDNTLTIDYVATTDKATPCNLTNHTYWNLSGDNAASIRDHVLTLHAEAYLPVDETLIPTGELRPVAGTPMDFNEPHAIGERIDQVEGGYDHCYVLPASEGCCECACQKWAAEVTHPASGRTMRVGTTEPGLQFYSGNFLAGALGRGNAKQGIHTGFCLEAEHFPDAVNQPSFASVILQPGQTYRQTTVHAFEF